MVARVFYDTRHKELPPAGLGLGGGAAARVVVDGARGQGGAAAQVVDRARGQGGAAAEQAWTCRGWWLVVRLDRFEPGPI